MIWMLSILGRLARKLRKRVGTVEYRKITHATPQDWDRLPEEVRMERGELKAKIIKLEAKLEGNRKQAKKRAKKTKVVKEISERAEYLRQRRMKEVMQRMKTRKKKIKLMSKDNKFLANFYDIAFVGGKYPGISFIGTIPGVKGKWSIMTAPSIDAMIHNPETVVDQIKAGYLQLNRMWDGTWVPDIKYHQPVSNNPGNPHGKKKGKKMKEEAKPITIERRAESYIGELHNRMSSMSSQLESLKKVLASETSEKENINMARNVERLRADKASAALYETMEAWNKWANAFMKTITKSQEDAIIQSSLHATVKPLIENTVTLRTMLMELIPADQRSVALEDLTQLLEKLKKFLPKEVVVKETKVVKEEKAKEVPPKQ